MSAHDQGSIQGSDSSVNDRSDFLGDGSAGQLPRSPAVPLPAGQPVDPFTAEMIGQIPDIAQMQYRYPDLEEMKFWSATPFTRHTLATARARGIPPFALILAHLERAAATIPPEIQTPDLGRGHVTLNWNGVSYGNPGTGKSTSHKVSRLSMPIEPDIAAEKPGTGEGLRDLFGHSIENGEILRERYNALIIADEGAILGALAASKTNTFLDTLREAYGGETLGNTNSRAGGRSTRIPESTYRLIFHINLQPAHAAVLWSSTQLGDGTIQRFVFADADILYLLPPGQELEPPSPMPDPFAGTGLLPASMDEYGMIHETEMLKHAPVLFSDLLDRRNYTDRNLPYRRDPLPDVYYRFIKNWDYAVKSGDKGPEYAHYAIQVIKLAYAFMACNGRAIPTAQDLALAQYMMGHSMRTLYRMRTDASKNETERAVSRGKRRGTEELAFRSVLDTTESKRETICENRIITILERAENNVLSTRSIRKMLPPHSRKDVFDTALQSLIDQGRVLTDTPKQTNQTLVHLVIEVNK